MKKIIKCLFFLVPALFSQIFAMEAPSKHDQEIEKRIIPKYTTLEGWIADCRNERREIKFNYTRYIEAGWSDDGLDERGGVIFKASPDSILVSYEHLDPQNAPPPSPESTLWLSPHYMVHHGKTESSFYYWVVSPLGKHGKIEGTFSCTQTQGNRFIVFWQGNLIEESLLARAFDLAFDCFSEDKNIDFKEIKFIVDTSNQYEAPFLRLTLRDFPVLRLALQELESYEKENKRPASQSIEDKFNELSKSVPKSDISSDLPASDFPFSKMFKYTLMRRVVPLANHTKEMLRDSNAALG